MIFIFRYLIFNAFLSFFISQKRIEPFSEKYLFISCKSEDFYSKLVQIRLPQIFMLFRINS